MSYPYLFRQRALYESFASHKEAVEAIRKASRAEVEQFVKKIWPHAFLYEHGDEWTILPLDWRDRQRIKEDHPGFVIPAHLSMTMRFRKCREFDAEQRAKAEEKMWRLAAFTVIEHDRTKELEAIRLHEDHLRN
jgi:hypothetical protein